MPTMLSSNTQHWGKQDLKAIVLALRAEPGDLAT